MDQSIESPTKSRTPEKARPHSKRAPRSPEPARPPRLLDQLRQAL
jgi:hypothetical protein